MRNGHILTEDSPKYLLKKHNTTSLEEVFLQICYSMDGKRDISVSSDILNNNKPYDKKEELREEKSIFDYQKSDYRNNGYVMPSTKEDTDSDSDVVQLNRYFIIYKYWALFFKNWIKLRGNISLVFFVLLLPSVEMFLFLLVTGPPHGLKVAVHSNENLSDSFSAQVLQTLDSKTISQVPFESLEKAIQSVESGQTTAVLSFAHNFTESLLGI